MQYTKKISRKHIFPFIIGFFLILFSNNPVAAQSTLLSQTLNKARQLRNEKKFTEAANLLGDFENRYPGNIWIEQMYGQTLFWMHDFQKAEKVYRKALTFHPEDPGLLYGYGILLFAEKKYNMAEKILLSFVEKQPGNFDAESILGKIYYYKGDFKLAASHFKNALNKNPGNNEIKNLYQEVYRIIHPNLSIIGDFRSDTQPMTSFGPYAKFQWYVSQLLNFDISGSLINYSKIPSFNTVSFFKLGNTFQFPERKISIKINGGKYYSSLNSSSAWGGRFQLRKTLFKNISLKAEALRTNYDYTVSSAEQLLMINRLSLGLSLGKQNSWNGDIGAFMEFYPDNNYMNAYYAWFLSKPVKLSSFNISFGYAFNYMNSKEDRFRTKLSQNVILASSNTNSSIEGVYDPYYTPHNQFSNSVLANISFDIDASTTIYGHASVGIYSKTNAPSFSIASNNGISSIVKNYNYQNFTPLDIGFLMISNLNRQWQLTLKYTFLQTYYYNSNSIRAGIKYYF